MSRYLHFDGMAWPNPIACDELDRVLRYGSAREIMENRLILASIVSAYNTIVMAGQRTRNSHAEKIKGAIKSGGNNHG